MSEPYDLPRAIALAAEIHSSQWDKGGQPYILHPIRVMQDVMRETDSRLLGIVAVLHDALEDNLIFAADALEQKIVTHFGDDVLMMLQILTRHRDQDYLLDYIRGIRDAEKNLPGIKKIKLADLRDNLNILRQPTLEDRDLQRLQKYHMAYRVLDR